MTKVSLAELVGLIAFDSDGVARGTDATLDFGLSAALLTDLHLAARIDVFSGYVGVVDPSPTGQRLLDATLERIKRDRSAHDPRRWIVRLTRSVRQGVLDRLIEIGEMRREKDNVLLVLRRTRYPTRDGLQSPLAADAFARIQAAAIGPYRADVATSALCGVVSGLGWHWRVLSGPPSESSVSRLEGFRRAFWAADALKAVVDEARFSMSGANREFPG